MSDEMGDGDDVAADGFPVWSHRAMDVIGALRLVMEASDSDHTRVQVVRRLLDEAPPQMDGDTASVKLFLDTVRAMGGEFSVR